MVRLYEIIDEPEDPDLPDWMQDPAYDAHLERMEKVHEIDETMKKCFRTRDDYDINDDTISAKDVTLKSYYT